MGQKSPLRHPVLFNALARGDPLWICWWTLYCRKLDRLCYPPVKTASFILTQYRRVTDRDTDRQKCYSNDLRSYLGIWALGDDEAPGFFGGNLCFCFYCFCQSRQRFVNNEITWQCWTYVSIAGRGTMRGLGVHGTTSSCVQNCRKFLKDRSTVKQHHLYGNCWKYFLGGPCLLALQGYLSPLFFSSTSLIVHAWQKWAGFAP